MTRGKKRTGAARHAQAKRAWRRKTAKERMRWLDRKRRRKG